MRLTKMPGIWKRVKRHESKSKQERTALLKNNKTARTRAILNTGSKSCQPCILDFMASLTTEKTP